MKETLILCDFLRCGWLRWTMREWDLPTALMTNEQLYMAIGIPMLFNAALMAMVFACLNANFNRLEKRFDNLVNTKSPTQW